MLLQTLFSNYVVPIDYVYQVFLHQTYFLISMFFFQLLKIV
jgi:hypothetical protein